MVKMSKTVTLIRHAQSMHNAGQCDTPEKLKNCGLSEYGKTQAAELSGNYEVVVVSTLRRARETLQCSKITAGRTVFSDLFREQKDSGEPFMGTEHLLNYIDDEPVKPENTDEVMNRAKHAADFLRALPETNVCVISHGVFMSYLLYQCGQKMQPSYNCQQIKFTIA
jgi:broad specificity phosphatase PhoE